MDACVLRDRQPWELASADSTRIKQALRLFYESYWFYLQHPNGPVTIFLPSVLQDAILEPLRYIAGHPCVVRALLTTDLLSKLNSTIVDTLELLISLYRFAVPTVCVRRCRPRHISTLYRLSAASSTRSPKNFVCGHLTPLIRVSTSSYAPFQWRTRCLTG